MVIKLLWFTAIILILSQNSMSAKIHICNNLLDEITV